MRSLIIISLFIISAFSLTLEESKHLLNRTSFGYTQAQLEFFMTLSKKQSVDYLLQNANSKQIHKLPLNLKENSMPLKGLDKAEKKKRRKAKNKTFNSLQNWWLGMMLDPKLAFREKMTLFWHNHFVSEYKVVKNPYLMYLQNRLYRQNALGNFRELLSLSSKDLAMLIYLDSNSNKKNSPNENYARELLELFTLGEGNYSEEDIKEAARAFTGYRAKKKGFKFIKVKKLHDNGIKNFMNQRGNFDGEDIINIVLNQEQTSRFIVRKLYKEFISYDLDNRLVEKISRKFRDSNYDISLVVKEILLSKKFWDSKALMIKAPTEFVLGFAKQLNSKKLKEKELRKMNSILRKLGQNLFNPPGVQGWSGGEAWIDVSSLLDRQNFIKSALKKKRKVIKKKNIQDFDSFSKYFFSVNVKEDMPFQNDFKVYEKYLSKLEYQLK